MHIDASRYPDPAQIAANIKRLNALGLQVHITELDIPDYNAANNPQTAQNQAQVYQKMLAACLNAKACTAFILWGFTDRYTWITSYKKKPGTLPLIFDENYQPKPAYTALLNELMK